MVGTACFVKTTDIRFLEKKNLCILHIKYKQKLTMKSHNSVQNNE